MDIRETTRCAACGGTFTQAEWEDRHSNESGDDVHASCCDDPECIATRRKAPKRMMYEIRARNSQRETGLIGPFLGHGKHGQPLEYETLVEAEKVREHLQQAFSFHHRPGLFEPVEVVVKEFQP